MVDGLADILDVHTPHWKEIMKLSSWQRLWVVVSGIWMIGIGSLYIVEPRGRPGIFVFVLVGFLALARSDAASHPPTLFLIVIKPKT